MKKMEIGFLGLGRMGKNMVCRLLDGGHKVVAWNRHKDPVLEVAEKGAMPAKNIPDLFKQLKARPRVVWSMLPSGEVSEKMLKKVARRLKKGDILIDGGNSNFHDSMRLHDLFAKKGIRFLDIGVSGGLVGAKKGYCMMAGGETKAWQHILPMIKSMCVKDGFGHMGPSGSGHYVKMVHNAIEYGMMQAMAEGFDLLGNGRFKDLNLQKVASVWGHGSIVQSFILDMAEQALAKDRKLNYLKPFVDDSGEGRWSAKEALDQGVPFVVNTYATHARFASRDKNSTAMRLLAAIRTEFGGHEIMKK
ncbi:MAG: phosphogluconate dehydrogenase (NAD(+)-dependent, decarboxylating) [Nanoarchaeota archaeon]